MKTANAVPNPGSNEAIDLGCTCPVIDNHHGRGVWTKEGALFWYNSNCPIHNPGATFTHQDKDIA